MTAELSVRARTVHDIGRPVSKDMSTCDTCKEQRQRDPSYTLYMYIGETDRGCYEWFRAHIETYKQKKGFMWKHAEEVHNASTKLTFSIKREAVDLDPMRRIIRESVRINGNEWNSEMLN